MPELMPRFVKGSFEVREPLTRRLFPNGEWVLLFVLLFEILIFSFAGRNFLTATNGFEVVRLSVEVGLLALALTPVIITGGIDLSVGSMMGLSAIVFGSLWRDAGVPLPIAATLTLLLGCCGGWFNALLITRLRLPPLIVTLGTFSLFRGLAEGLTGGVDNYSGFPHSFLYLGQGYLGDVIPTQALILLAVAVLYGLILHRTTLGRGLYAIGFSSEGARYAGIPVAKRLSLVYLSSGCAASLAGLIYVAHLGQAKADAGINYELLAITAVVLGGTSIFGGRGSVLGTMLGLSAIVVLQNGLRLATLPAELAGILTGLLLIASISIDKLYARTTTTRALRLDTELEEPPMKNSQLAVLSVVIVASAILVAASNWLLVRTFQDEAPSGASVNRSFTGSSQSYDATQRKPVIAMMPKAKGDPYFVSSRKGAEEAARELEVELIWDGPTELDPAKQNEVVEGWITRGVDVVAVSVENQAGISTVLRKARAKNINVVTWDADAESNARNFFINQATPQGIGYTLADEAARIMGGTGEFAIVTASLSAANQNEWIKFVKKRIAEKYSDMKLVAIQPSDGDRDRAFVETQTILKVYPNVKVIMGIAVPAVPGAAEAVKQSGRTDVKVTGLSLPNMCKPYFRAGVIDNIVLWNTQDLGYLTVYTAQALSTGKIKAGDTSLQAGRLGRIEIRDDQVMLGAPFVFTKENVEQFDF